MFLLDLHRIGSLASLFIRSCASTHKLNETQALIVLHLQGELDQCEAMAPIDIAKSIICSLSTVVSQMTTLLREGIIEKAPSAQIREVSAKGRKLYRLTRHGRELSARLRQSLDEVSLLLRSAVHRTSETGSKELSQLLFEWSAEGALQSEAALRKALMLNAIRVPRRQR